MIKFFPGHLQASPLMEHESKPSDDWSVAGNKRKQRGQRNVTEQSEGRGQGATVTVASTTPSTVGQSPQEPKRVTHVEQRSVDKPKSSPKGAPLPADRRQRQQGAVHSVPSYPPHHKAHPVSKEEQTPYEGPPLSNIRPTTGTSAKDNTSGI